MATIRLPPMPPMPPTPPTGRLRELLQRLHITPSLKPILRTLHLPQTGRKDDLIERIKVHLLNAPIAQLEGAFAVLRAYGGDEWTGEAIIEEVRHARGIGVKRAPQPLAGALVTAAPPTAPMPIAPAAPPTSAEVRFETSPFWEPVEPLTALHFTRPPGNSLMLQFQLTPQQHARLAEPGPTHRMLMYSALKDEILNTGRANAIVSLPRPARVRLQTKEIQFNKYANQPPAYQAPLDLAKLLDDPPVGTPLTLTVMILSTPSQYSYDQFGLRVMIVRLVPLERLEDLVRLGKNMTTHEAQWLLRNSNARTSRRFEGDDVVAVASEMSLACPIGLTRIRTPVKGVHCRHQQCFDLTNFLAMNARSPTWVCPICSKMITFAQLHVHTELMQLLETLPKDVSSISIDPDGHFRLPSASAGAAPAPTPAATPAASTPQTPARDGAASVVSLLSSDEDEGEADRPTAKRARRSPAKIEETDADEDNATDAQTSSDSERYDFLAGLDDRFWSEIDALSSQADEPAPGRQALGSAPGDAIQLD